MAFVKKQDNSSGEMFKFEAVGDSITGIYSGSYDFEGDYGPTKKHIFKTDEGLKVVFGQKNLTDQLSDLEVGSLVRVTFEETKKMAKGRNPLKLFSIEVDTDFTPDPDAAAEAAEAVANDADQGDVADEEEAADEIKTAPAKAKPRASAPDAGRQAQVQALLNKNRKGAAA